MDIDGILSSAVDSFGQGHQLNSASVSPNVSSKTVLTRKSRESLRNRSNRLSERRISISTISPFKSPSLSSWPQTEVMYSSRSQTLNRSLRSENGNKAEFSSSFEKFLRNHSAASSQNSWSFNVTTDSTGARRWSHVSDTSNSSPEQDRKGLESFMKLINGTQELTMFQHRSSHHPSVVKKESKRSTNNTLSRFRYLQESYAALSVSIYLGNVANNEKVRPLNKSSTQSSSKSSFNHKHTNSTDSTSALRTLISFGSPTSHYNPLGEPFKERHRSHSRSGSSRNSGSSANDFSSITLTSEQVHVVANSPLRNRKTPPVPPPKMPYYESGYADNDDDDSLVFEMSEICDEEGHF